MVIYSCLRILAYIYIYMSIFPLRQVAMCGISTMFVPGRQRWGQQQSWTCSLGIKVGEGRLLPPFPANIDEGLVSLMGLLTIMIPSKSLKLRPAMYFAGFWRWQLGWVGPLDSHDERSWPVHPPSNSIPSQVINPGRWLRQQKHPVESTRKKHHPKHAGLPVWWRGKERQVKWTKMEMETAIVIH